MIFFAATLILSIKALISIRLTRGDFNPMLAWFSLAGALVSALALAILILFNSNKTKP